MTGIKIVATIGPKTNTPAALKELIAAGMGIARLNGSHSDLGWHADTIRLIRSIAPEVPILLDIPGRKIRTQKLAHEPSFEAGDVVVFTTENGHDGTIKVSVNKDDLHELLKAGDDVFADDGTLRFTVMQVCERDIHCRAEIAGTLKSAKGINVPSMRQQEGPMQERDIRMIAFACEQGVDYVGISFVDSAQLAESVRAKIPIGGPRVLSKVENLGAMNNLEAVIGASDAIMIDRGDLSVETNLESIAIFQKRIIEVSRRYGKPVIVATELLHSMIEHPYPTKAEVSDISNAVLDGASALMLSGETAIGKFPAASVAMMRRVADVVIGAIQHDAAATPVSSNAMADAISLLSRSMPITKILAVTASGYAASAVANTRPRQPILAVSCNAATARGANLFFGTTGVHVDIPFTQTSTDHLAMCMEAVWRRGLIHDDDMILLVAVGYPKSGNLMNLIQIHAVADLRVSLGWVN